MTLSRPMATLPRPALLLALALATAGAGAAQLRVSPVKLHFSPDVRVQELAIANPGREAVAVELTLHRWPQGADMSEDSLVATRDLLATPPILEIAPGEREYIRVGLRRTLDADRCEHAFRLLVTEIPAPREETGRPAEDRGPVRLATRLSLPLFVHTQEDCRPQLDWQVDGGELLIRNRGQAHTQLRDLTAVVGGSEIDLPLKGLGYLLPGEHIRVALPAALTPARPDHQLRIKTSKTDQHGPLTRR